jgi:hypothetical protein
MLGYYPECCSSMAIRPCSLVGLYRNFGEKYCLYILLGVCNAVKNSQCILWVFCISVEIDVLLETGPKLLMVNDEVLIAAGICSVYYFQYNFFFFQKYLAKTAQGKTAVSMTLLQTFSHYLLNRFTVNYFSGLTVSHRLYGLIFLYF